MSILLVDIRTGIRTSTELSGVALDLYLRENPDIKKVGIGTTANQPYYISLNETTEEFRSPYVNGNFVYNPGLVRMGIGTANPQATLDINGEIRLRSGLYDSFNNVGTSTSVLISTGIGVSWISIATATLQGVQGAQGAAGSTGAQGVQGAVGAQGSAGSGGSITDDTSTNATRYITFDDQTSGAINGLYVSSSKLTYNPSLGKLIVDQNNIWSGLAGDQGSMGIGYAALESTTINGNITTGGRNTAIGYEAMRNTTTGKINTALGLRALYSNTEGASNTAIGAEAMRNFVTGTDAIQAPNGRNTAIGCLALYTNTSGHNNVAIGQNSGWQHTGSNNITIGSEAYGSTIHTIGSTNNKIVMGNNSHSAAYIQIAWTVVSDKRDKININNIPLGINFVNKLKPVSYQFRYNRESDDINGKTRYGFLAQDVLEAEGDNPVICDNSDENKLYMTTDYLLPILVNAIKELSEKIERLEKN